MLDKYVQLKINQDNLKTDMQDLLGLVGGIITKSLALAIVSSSETTLREEMVAL